MLQVIIGAVVLLIVLYFILEQNKKLYDTIAKNQDSFFRSMGEYARKSDLLITKNNQQFLKVFAQVFRKDLPKVTEEEDLVENSIEDASEPEEVLLSDSPRIPIVEGVKIKFEDETEVYPMNINPIEDYQDDSKVNPIEKTK